MNTSFLAALAVAGVCLAPNTFAGEIRTATAAELRQVVTRSAPVLVHAHADWCPICARQATTLGTLMARPEYESLTVLVVDFDKNKSELRELNVSRQSTLILYSNGQESDRLIGVTDPEKIAAFLDSARDGAGF